MPTKQQNLKQLNDLIVERRLYLKSIEEQIEDFSVLANNKLFELNGQINEAEKELAKVMRRSYEIDQKNREKQRLAI